jgi:hypothetical protein
MRSGANGRGHLSETDRGNRLAATASPAPIKPANDIEHPPDRVPLPRFRMSSIEVLKPGPHAVLEDPIEDDDAIAMEIKAMFRRKLIGMRRLLRSERAAALRAAREWLFAALLALRQMRAQRRQDKRTRRRLQRPSPG